MPIKRGGSNARFTRHSRKLRLAKLRSALNWLNAASPANGGFFLFVALLRPSRCLILAKSTAGTIPENEHTGLLQVVNER